MGLGSLGEGRNFGHLAYEVEDGPPPARNSRCRHCHQPAAARRCDNPAGTLADNVSIELLQAGEPLPATEPWASVENTGVVT